MFESVVGASILFQSVENIGESEHDSSNESGKVQ